MGLSCIKSLILAQHAFKEASVGFSDTYDKMVLCFDIEPVKKIINAVSQIQFHLMFGKLIAMHPSILVNTFSVHISSIVV